MSTVLIVLSLVMAAWTASSAALNRPVGNATLIGLGLMELLAIVQLVIGIVLLVAGDDRPPSVPTFLAYLVGALFLVPVGTLWSLAEKSRSSTLVLTVVCLALPVMTVRMLQMWSGRG